MRIRRFGAAGLLAAAVAVAGPALGQSVCAAPPLPTPISIEPVVKPKPPEKPACVERNRCRDADVDHYNTAIAKFNAELFEFNQKQNDQETRLNGYVAQLNQYSGLTDAYLNCEHRRLVSILDANR